MDTLIAPLQPVIAAPEQVPAIRPFNFDMKVLLATEDTAGAMSVIVAWHNPGEARPTMCTSIRRKFSLSSMVFTN